MSKPKPRNHELWLFMLELGRWRTTTELLGALPGWGRRPSDRRAMSASLRTFTRARMCERRLRDKTRDYEFRVMPTCVSAQGVKVEQILQAVQVMESDT